MFQSSASKLDDSSFVCQCKRRKLCIWDKFRRIKIVIVLYMHNFCIYSQKLIFFCGILCIYGQTFYCNNDHYFSLVHGNSPIREFDLLCLFFLSHTFEKTYTQRKKSPAVAEERDVKRIYCFVNHIGTN